MRRRSHHRAWTKEEEDLLLTFTPSSPELSEAEMENAIEAFWDGAKQEHLSGQELHHKYVALQRIQAMLSVGHHDKVGDEIGHAKEEESIVERMGDAVREGSLDKLKKLTTLHNHALTGGDELGRQVIHHAAQLGHQDILTFVGGAMRHHNMPIDNEDVFGNTPLLLAIMNGREEAAEYLLDIGADCRHQNKKGASPLHMACHTNNMKIVQLLLTRKVDVNLRDALGHTPLHVASFRATQDLCLVLMDAGADPDAKNNKGQTASKLARTMSKTANEQTIKQRMKTAMTAVRAAVRMIGLQKAFGSGSPLLRKGKQSPTGSPQKEM